MKNARPALRYAKAILNLATDKEVGAEVNNDMKLVSETIAESKDLRVMLESPVIKATDKTRVLNTLFKGKINDITKGLFTVLQENKRLMMLDSVAKQYSVVYAHYKNFQVAKVTTAVALTEELEQKIKEKIVELTGNDATIENNIDPSILGGFILRVGDMQYDASISNRFKELRKQFDNSQYISKN